MHQPLLFVDDFFAGIEVYLVAKIGKLKARVVHPIKFEISGNQGM